VALFDFVVLSEIVASTQDLDICRVFGKTALRVGNDVIEVKSEAMNDRLDELSAGVDEIVSVSVERACHSEWPLSVDNPSGQNYGCVRDYFFFAALNFAHRFFWAAMILLRASGDRTRLAVSLRAVPLELMDSIAVIAASRRLRSERSSVRIEVKSDIL
jgi:hypothetical protein